MLLIAILSVGATVFTGKSPLLGLDLKGGVSVVLKPEGTVNATILAQAVTIINNRVDGLGVSNSQVTQEGNDIDIELPGAKNDTQVLSVVGETAQLFFRPVECEITPYLAAATTTPAKGKVTTTTRPGTAKVKPKTTSTTAKSKRSPVTTVRKTTSTTATKSATGPLGQALAPSTLDTQLASDRYPLAAGTPAAAAAANTTTGTTTPVTPTTTKAGSPTTTKAGSPTTTKAGSPTTGTTLPLTTTTTSQSSSVCGLSTAQQELYQPPHSDQYGLTPAQYDSKDATVVLPYYSDFTKGKYTLDDRFVLGPANMTGGIVKSATATVDTSTGEWQVDLSFTGAGSTQFNNFASQYYQCYLQDKTSPPDAAGGGVTGATACPPYGAQQAIELDATVYSNPAIEASSFPGGATINGSTASPFTGAEASDLANALNYGSLPVRFSPQDIQNVSPLIGTDSLRAGAIAGAVAVLLVIIYLLIYYRALGLVVVLGIVMSGAYLYSVTTLLSDTEGLALTLSGVIGLIVSVGVTADSCVVYFERLKEEIRSGRTVRTSVEKGFSRAFRTILAADFSSFIAALILYTLTVGDVRGFAFFLGLATLLNVITTYFFTRPLVILIGRRAALGQGGFMGVSRGLGAGSFGQ